MKLFSPDLIVECTQVCDRACVGCYAPNVVSKSGGELLFQKNPELFLTEESLTLALSNINLNLGSIAIRGGEPSRHPEIAALIRIAAKRGHVILETHGRWLLSDESIALVETLKETDSTVKISFDKMHGTSAEELTAMTSRLANEGIDHLIAITEDSPEDFVITRNHCAFIPDGKIVFQKKAASSEELIRPRLGVIGVNGQLKTFLEHRGDLLKGTLSA